MALPEMQIGLNERDTRFILEALEELEAKWRSVARTSRDEDVQAEYGMDAGVLSMTKDYFKEAAIRAFGPEVTKNERTPVPVESLG